MALGLTDHVWSYREYIWLPVHADPALAQQMAERIARLLTPAFRTHPGGNMQEKSPPVEIKEEEKAEANPMPKAA
jgi:hypothetical protein